MRKNEGPSEAPLRPQRVFLLAFLSAVSLWASLPPLQIWPLAWISSLFWLLLIRHRDWESPRIEVTVSGWRKWLGAPGRAVRRPYGLIWTAGLVHWLGLMYGICLAFWANAIGWLLLSMYLALYLPLFIGLTRVAVHKLAVPLCLAAPVVWTGLELFRCYVFTGFGGALLGHSQVAWPGVIQIADTFGAYGVSFVIMLFTACLADAMPTAKRPGWRAAPLLLAAVVVGGTLAYGHYRLGQPQAQIEKVDTSVPKPQDAIRVALVQCSFDTVFGAPDEKRDRKVFQHYVDQSIRARDRWPDLDLIVWPEGTYSAGLFETLIEGKMQIPPGQDPDGFRKTLREWQISSADKARRLAQLINRSGPQGRTSSTHVLVGTETEVRRGLRSSMYNTSLHIDPDGRIVNRYHKMHLVMFGEYTPGARFFPFLYRIGPLGGGLTPGEKPVAFDVNGHQLSPCICFETFVPRLIRRQVLALTAQGRQPQFLINMTNDGWFWGSSILDIHFHCSIFRALENRMPLLVAANTGYTAWVDSSGRVSARAPKRKEHVILVQVRPDDRGSIYLRIGDWPARICALCCLLLAIVGWWRRDR